MLCVQLPSRIRADILRDLLRYRRQWEGNQREAVSCRKPHAALCYSISGSCSFHNTLKTNVIIQVILYQNSPCFSWNTNIHIWPANIKYLKALWELGDLPNSNQSCTLNHDTGLGNFCQVFQDRHKTKQWKLKSKMSNIWSNSCHWNWKPKFFQWSIVTDTWSLPASTNALYLAPSDCLLLIYQCFLGGEQKSRSPSRQLSISLSPIKQGPYSQTSS